MILIAHEAAVRRHKGGRSSVSQIKYTVGLLQAVAAWLGEAEVVSGNRVVSFPPELHSNEMVYTPNALRVCKLASILFLA
jgi:hypothetical protein